MKFDTITPAELAATSVATVEECREIQKRFRDEQPHVIEEISRVAIDSLQLGVNPVHIAVGAAAGLYCLLSRQLDGKELRELYSVEDQRESIR